MSSLTASIAAALALGATSGIADATKKAVSDGYESVKALIKKKFEHQRDVTEAIDKLETIPNLKRDKKFWQRKLLKRQ